MVNVLISRINYILFFLFMLLILAGLSFLPSTHAVSSFYDDPFYKQKGTDRVPATFQQVAESVNPFTGNVNLTHTDAILLGNGGLDLKIMCSYNSRVYGKKMKIMQMT